MMSIQCKICNKEYPKLISSTHLKSHGIKTAEYVDQYGRDSLASDEYRKEKSKKNSGINNPNFGNKMSTASKKTISKKNLGKVPWNKGITFEDTQNQKESAKKREDRYKSNELERYIPVHSQETKDKISDSVTDYAKNNPNKMKTRAAKALKTKIKNEYFIKKKTATKEKYIQKCSSYGFTASVIDNDLVMIECNECKSTHTRNISSVIHNKMCPLCSSVGVSSYESEILDEIKKMTNTTCIISDRSILGNLELDIFLPDHNLAIEINGLYWHSEEMGKGRYYHSYKTNKCKEKGIQLIHIFEDEWLYKRNICIERIKSKIGISSVTYARKMHIKEITNKEAYVFLTDTHIQGRGTAASHCYGLFNDNEEIVAVMTFSKLSIAKGSKHVDGKYELNRYASTGNVVGGASRLLKHFIKQINPDEIVSYSDIRWNTGNLYGILGFEYAGNTQPNYWYVMGTNRMHRYKLRKTDKDPIDITEKVLRTEEGYRRIWDCGHSKWIWKNDSSLTAT